MTLSTYSLPVTETVKTAWAKVHGVKGSIWAVIGIFFVIQLILGICSNLGAQAFFSILSSIVQVLTGMSLVYLGVRRAQDAPIQYKMIKEILTLRTFLFIVGLYILQIIIFIPAGIVAGIGIYLVQAQAEPSTGMQIVGGLFYLAAAIIFVFLSVRLWLGYGAVIDKQLNPWEAVKFSFKSTEGNVWNLIGIMIINVLIIFVSALTLGIAFIWTMPWLLIIYGETYKRLAARG
ncbi:MAG TPA: hypothetical protein VLI69_05910 [Gammaproteobacteria bacterium]|nr:hypothetical protein [Gammaproteobacteria bacterium]